MHQFLRCLSDMALYILYAVCVLQAMTGFLQWLHNLGYTLN